MKRGLIKHSIKDLYIGPNSVLTISGDVEITGDIYVYGTIKSYGDLTVKGTLHAKDVNWGYGRQVFHGSAQIISGTNNISSIIVGNQPYEIPFDINNESLTNETGSIEVEGRTLPYLNVNVQGQDIPLEQNGSFQATINNVTTDSVTFEVRDVFGNIIEKQFSIQDVIAPTQVENFGYVKSSTNSIHVTWGENTDSDLEKYNLKPEGLTLDSDA